MVKSHLFYSSTITRCLVTVMRLIIKDGQPPSQLGQNRHNMWQHEILCDTTIYQSQQREGGGGGRVRS